MERTPISGRNAGQRNPWIEMLRIVAMLMILTAHLLSMSGWPVWQVTPGLRGSLIRTTINVMGLGGSGLFFVITGYFMVDRPFRVKRIVRVWTQTLCYTLGILTAVAAVQWGAGVPFSQGLVSQGNGLVRNILFAVLPVFNTSYWFITAYLVLLLLAPFLNTLFASMSSRAMTALTVFVAFLSLWPAVSLSSGYWNDLGFAILGYLIGAWLRMHPDFVRHRGTVGAALVLIPLSVAALLAFDYLSQGPWTGVAELFGWNTKFWITGGRIVLLPLLTVTSLFVLALHGPSLGRRTTACIDFIATGVFGVYLIHVDDIIGGWLWTRVSTLLGVTGASMDRQLSLAVPTVIGLFIVYCAAATIYDRLVVRPVQRAVTQLLPLRHSRPAHA